MNGAGKLDVGGEVEKWLLTLSLDKVPRCCSPFMYTLGFTGPAMAMTLTRTEMMSLH
jgi:hypothetical protein